MSDFMFIIDDLFEKKQTIMSNEDEISKLQAQVEASSSEKDTLIAKFEAMAKKSEGKVKTYNSMGNISGQQIFAVMRGQRK